MPVPSVCEWLDGLGQGTAPPGRLVQGDHVLGEQSLTPVWLQRRVGSQEVPVAPWGRGPSRAPIGVPQGLAHSLGAWEVIGDSWRSRGLWERGQQG